jgi:hypothetical protein
MDNIKKLIIFQRVYSNEIEIFIKEKSFKKIEELPLLLTYINGVSIWEKL